MIYTLLVAAGILLLGYSLLTCRRIIDIVQTKGESRGWKFIFVLVCFFILGYAGFVAEHLMGRTTSNDDLISLVFFFGAVFVVFTLKYTLNVIMLLTLANKELHGENMILKKHRSSLRRKDSSLESRNRELQETIDELYSMDVSSKRRGK